MYAPIRTPWSGTGAKKPYPRYQKFDSCNMEVGAGGQIERRAPPVQRSKKGGDAVNVKKTGGKMGRP